RIPFLDIENYLINQLESDEYVNGDQIQKKLQKAILKLPEKQRLVFNMKYFDDMKYEDMSEILDTSVGALKASYHHAVKKIEKYLQEN
ncbi:MAG: sigma-70 family RNA polymerase sigma factor, partial [Bacteroidales bacterium]|nr:sigma-70 family RNA polymerase sigma factor [Bacteroidales bacterium]